MNMNTKTATTHFVRRFRIKQMVSAEPGWSAVMRYKQDVDQPDEYEEYAVVAWASYEERKDEYRKDGRLVEQGVWDGNACGALVVNEDPLEAEAVQPRLDVEIENYVVNAELLGYRRLGPTVTLENWLKRRLPQPKESKSDG